MPDLMPPTGFYSKPQDLGSLFGVAQGIQRFQGQQGISDLMKQNRDPITDEPDFGAVLAGLPRVQGIVSPEQIINIEQARQSQLTTRTRQVEAIGRIMGPLADKPNLTDKDIADAKLRLAGVYGGDKRGTAIANRILEGTEHDPKKFRERMTQIQTGYDMLPATEQIEGRYGPVPITKVAYTQALREAQATGAPGPRPYNEEMRKDYTEAGRHAGTYQVDVTPWKEAHNAVAGLPEGKVGPGNEAKFAAMKLAHNLGWDISEEGMRDANNYDRARKYLEAAMMRMPGASQSVEHLASAITANPNVKTLEKLNVLQLVKTALALRRMEHVGYMQFQREMDKDPRLLPSQFRDWYAKWQTKQDVKAFVVDTFNGDKEGSQKFEKEIRKSPETQKRFKESHDAAEAAGVYEPDFNWNAGTK